MRVRGINVEEGGHVETSRVVEDKKFYKAYMLGKANGCGMKSYKIVLLPMSFKNNPTTKLLAPIHRRSWMPTQALIVLQATAIIFFNLEYCSVIFTHWCAYEDKWYSNHLTTITLPKIVKLLVQLFFSRISCSNSQCNTCICQFQIFIKCLYFSQLVMLRLECSIHFGKTRFNKAWIPKLANTFSKCLNSKFETYHLILPRKMKKKIVRGNLWIP